MRPRLVSALHLVERGLLDLPTAQCLLERARFLGAEAGAGPPVIDQALALVVADQQRADAPSGARRRVATDHELVTVDAFGLDPVAAAAGAVGTVLALRHHP